MLLVLRALGEIGPAGAAAAPEVAAILDRPWCGYDQVALETLGRMGPAAAAARPRMVRFLADDDREVRARARTALRALDAPR